MNGGVNEGKLQLFEFLRGLSHKGQHLLVNPHKLLSLQQLQQALLRGDRYLDEFDDEVGAGLFSLCILVFVGGFQHISF
jgi:hypothetical protein